MSIIDLLLLALGLAMDAAAVSAARGLAVGGIRARHLVLVAVFFGGAQALMPLLGFLLGQQLGPIIAAIHHWVAFGLLVFLGARMIKESFDDDDEAVAADDPFALPTMAALSVATSIDAFAVGVVLPALGASLFIAVIVIGIVTALLSMLGLALGARLGRHLGSRLDLIGGVVLVGLGVRFLVEGLTGG